MMLRINSLKVETYDLQTLNHDFFNYDFNNFFIVKRTVSLSEGKFKADCYKLWAFSYAKIIPCNFIGFLINVILNFLSLF